MVIQPTSIPKHTRCPVDKASQVRRAPSAAVHIASAMAAVTGEGGWRLVRYLPPCDHWHPAIDHLAGTERYGNPAGSGGEAWTVPFGDFDEFLFATGDCTRWPTKRSVVRHCRGPDLGTHGSTHVNFQDIASMS